MANVARKSDQLTVITVDDDVEKIIQLDAKGERFRFATEPGRFKELASGEVAKLSEFAKLSYKIARDEAGDKRDRVRMEEEDLLSRITVGVGMGSATQRLRIQGRVETMDYRWIRPDEQEVFMAPNKGWTVVKDGPERTLQNQTGEGPHVIGTKGSEELILVKRPLRASQAEDKARRLRAQQEKRQENEEYRAAIEATGLRSIGDDDQRGWVDRTGAQDE